MVSKLSQTHGRETRHKCLLPDRFGSSHLDVDRLLSAVADAGCESREERGSQRVRRMLHQRS